MREKHDCLAGRQPAEQGRHPPAVLSAGTFRGRPRAGEDRSGAELATAVRQRQRRRRAYLESGFTSRAGCRRPVLAGRDTTAAGKKLPSAERRARALSKRPDASSEA
jgi:hypothetical protein